MNHLEEAFNEFHGENPRVYQLFCEYAQELIGRGYTRFSSDAILHRVRWRVEVDEGGKRMRLNDHWTAYYARLWLHDHPKQPRFFELRTITRN